MVQEFNVVRCFSCETFQVDQVKKSSQKWTCKICQEKQSLKQIYFQGNGKECRLNCQQLNMSRKDHKMIDKQHCLDMIEKERSNIDANIESHEEISSSTVLMERREKNSTKWSAFVDVNTPKSPDKSLSSRKESVEIRFRGEFQPSRNRKRTFRKRCSDEDERVACEWDTDFRRSDSSRLYAQTDSPKLCKNKQTLHNQMNMRSQIVDNKKTHFVPDTNMVKTSQQFKNRVSPSYGHKTNGSKKYDNEDDRPVQKMVAKDASKWSMFIQNEEEEASADENTEICVGFS
ncbi:MRN complex-interacting protein-like [Hydractinia symbiolongicarpus]|uniref:MRN complex-interacting protein-like n=1 Tax=Hydractinia symbiolongicarpus TaxID=13093 RepID=UPI00254A6E64|nr:MRN complex-interacting protein-like [Hydractinia symbiolongicarpus]XP_057307290.1 MRN complex-interacting protein-like [Hydractinia symbiolongicarpus]XP_057307291.1 MRN complex-interacting protein-like [Hydractinia symbiolongicarpus]